MVILGIDPGPHTSGVVIYSTWRNFVISANGEMENDLVLRHVRAESDSWGIYDLVACESIEAMYAHVGKSTVLTLRFIGRIEEAADCRGRDYMLISPQEIKKRVCGTASAKDAAVRQALIDLLGEPGTKKNPGPTYGVSKHAWRALAAAVAAQILNDK